MYDPQANYAYTGGPFGTQPQPVPMPRPDLDLAGQIPGLTKLNANASGVINNELSGQLSPDTLAAIRNAGAGWAVNNGMPGLGGGTLGGNRTLRDVGLTSMQQQQQGIKDYASFVPVVAGTQTVAPTLQADINQNNSVNAAAPSPAAAQSYAEQLFTKYINTLNQTPSKAPKKTLTSSYQAYNASPTGQGAPLGGPQNQYLYI